VSSISTTCSSISRTLASSNWNSSWDALVDHLNFNYICRWDHYKPQENSS
jgi:hypothetical protein